MDVNPDDWSGIVEEICLGLSIGCGCRVTVNWFATGVSSFRGIDPVFTVNWFASVTS